MNIKRLQTLATFLRTVPSEHFNLQSWRHHPGCKQFVSDADLTTLQCGTTGCAVGWACSMPEFQAQGLTWDTDGIGAGYPVCAFKGIPDYYSAWEAVEKFFGIPSETAERMFMEEEYDGDGTADDVADRIESFIAQELGA